MPYKDFDIKPITWEAARKKIQPNNKLFVDLIDNLSPSKKFKLYVAKYGYGDNFLKRGVFHLRTSSGTLIPITSEKVPQEIRGDFLYSGGTTPVMVVLNKHLELYIQSGSRVIPFLQVQPGNMYGVWKILDQSYNDDECHAPYNIWHMTSGARSLLVLPKISENQGYSRLQKKYHLNIDKPKGYLDHWNIFSHLYKSPKFDGEWESEILLFSGEWFKYLNDETWKDFRLHLLDFNWKCSEYWRNQFVWRMVLTEIHHKLKIAPPQHYVDIAMHLFAISLGALPGFEPAVNDKQAPIKRLQEIFINDYGLKWPPIILQPAFFDINKNDSIVYQSLQHNTCLDFSPKSSQRSSTIRDLYMVNSLMKKYLREIPLSNFGLDDLLISKVCTKVNYDYYHTNTSDYTGINPIENILEDDRFNDLSVKMGYNSVPLSSSYFQGCIKISNKS